jgi:NAD+ kinase
MESTFTSAGMIGRHDDTRVIPIIERISAYLQKHRIDTILEKSTAELMPGHNMKTGSRHDIGEHCDLAIVVGGDGTLLDAARTLSDYDVPLVGIHLGRLGFLADITPDVLDKCISSIIEGDYIEDRRFLLRAEIERDNEQIGASDAFNDVVVHKWNVARMIELELFINGSFVSSERSDGLIVATPTGSTAYALSGGGPIVHPALMALVIVPICPHTLSHRPIVIEADSRIEIVICDSNRDQVQATCDGQISFGLQSSDRIVITRKRHFARLIHPAGHDYFEILRRKLRWSTNL